jgi:hypothetical protein
MRILITVVSADETICRTIEARQGQLVPESFRKRDHDAFAGASFELTCFKVVGSVSEDQLLDYLERRMKPDTCGIVILSDRSLGLATRSLSDLYFMNEYDQHGPAKSPHNMLSSLLNRVLKDFGHLTIRFVDAKYQKILRLPVRNFVAPELEQLRKACVSSIDTPAFPRRLDAALGAFRDRQQPKRKSSYRDEYLIDDEKKHFQLGHERHARADTGHPHVRLCRLGNLHRFGRGFDHEQHYNVSMDGKNATMDGKYPDCHGEERSGEGRPHLNMFTNDFF